MEQDLTLQIIKAILEGSAITGGIAFLILLVLFSPRLLDRALKLLEGWDASQMRRRQDEEASREKDRALEREAMQRTAAVNDVLANAIKVLNKNLERAADSEEAHRLRLVRLEERQAQIDAELQAKTEALDKALTELEQAKARISELESGNEDDRKRITELEGEVEKLRSENERLRVENNRLKQAREASAKTSQKKADAKAGAETPQEDKKDAHDE